MDYTYKKYLSITNAKILTMQNDSRIYRSMLINLDNGLIEEVNTKSNPNYYGKEIEIIDLYRKTVMPGFIDAHIHLYDGGVFSKWLNLTNCKNLSEIKESLNEYLYQGEYLNWIIGYGFTDEAFGGIDNVNIKTMDTLTSDKPMLWIKNGGHSALLNSRALKEYPISNIKDYPNIDESLIEYKNGQFTGVLKEIAYKTYMDKSGASVVKDKPNLIMDTINYLSSQGITCIHDNTFDKEIFQVYRQLENENKLNLRINSFLYGYDQEKRAELIPYLNETSELIRIIGAKYFIDGSINSKTAYLREPYLDSDDRGLICVDKSLLMEKMDHDISLNLQPIMHCIGDGGIEFCLDIISDKISDTNLVRPRLEHCTVLSEDLMERLKGIKPIITYQQGELNDDVLSLYQKRLGKQRMTHLDEVRFMLDNSIPVAFSSDWPYINPPEPLTMLEYYKQQNNDVSIKEMLTIYTKYNAYAGYDESSLGVIKEGYNADFLVLSDNPFNKHFNSERPLDDIQIKKTFINGRKVYDIEYI